MDLIKFNSDRSVSLF